jgi:hypothetical protein
LAQDAFQKGDDPLTFVKPFGGHVVDGLVPTLGFTQVEVEREQRLSTSTFLSGVLLAFIKQEVAKGGDQKRSKAASFFLGDRYGVALEEVGEEALHGVLRLVDVAEPAAGVSVEGYPIAATKLLQRIPRMGDVALAGGQDEAPLRAGKIRRAGVFGAMLGVGGRHGPSGVRG